jgi:hypothetical protein
MNLKNITEQIINQDERIKDEYGFWFSLCHLQLSEYKVVPVFAEYIFPDGGLVLSFRIANRELTQMACSYDYRCREDEVVDGKINVSPEIILDNMYRLKNGLVLSGLTHAIKS